MPRLSHPQVCTSTGKTTVLVVDDHPVLRAGLRSLLSGEHDIEVTGDVASGEDAYRWYRAHRADVVLMDLAMSGYGGMEALRRILQFDPVARIIVYSVYSTEVMLNRALALGALGYVTKCCDVDVLLTGIREVAQQRGYVSPDMIPVMVRHRVVPERVPLEQLSDREFQILLLTAQGQSVSECAKVLCLSEKTVRNYLTRIKNKLQAADTAELTRLAIRMGLTGL